MGTLKGLGGGVCGRIVATSPEVVPDAMFRQDLHFTTLPRDRWSKKKKKKLPSMFFSVKILVCRDHFSPIHTPKEEKGCCALASHLQQGDDSGVRWSSLFPLQLDLTPLSHLTECHCKPDMEMSRILSLVIECFFFFPHYPLTHNPKDLPCDSLASPALPGHACDSDIWLKWRFAASYDLCDLSC